MPFGAYLTPDRIPSSTGTTVAASASDVGQLYRRYRIFATTARASSQSQIGSQGEKVLITISNQRVHVNSLYLFVLKYASYPYRSVACKIR